MPLSLSRSTFHLRRLHTGAVTDAATYATDGFRKWHVATERPGRLAQRPGVGAFVLR